MSRLNNYLNKYKDKVAYNKSIKAENKIIRKKLKLSKYFIKYVNASLRVIIVSSNPTTEEEKQMLEKGLKAYKEAIADIEKSIY